MPTNVPPDYDKLWKACIEYENRIAELEAELEQKDKVYALMRELISDLRRDLDIPPNETGLRSKLRDVLAERDALIETLAGHDREMLLKKAKWLKGTDGEGWAIGELVECLLEGGE